VSGYRCYDSSLYSCEVNDAGQTVLCSNGDSACGSTCYDPTQFICETGELLCGYHKGAAIKACGGACYDTTSYACCGSSLYLINNIPSDCAALANASSGPGPLFCSAITQTPCDLGWCCNGECFDAQKYTCFDDQICPLGNEVCNGTCFDPNTQECCNNGLFAYGTSVCSEASATCCSCSCNAQIVALGPNLYTVASSAQCNSAFIGAHFPEALDCPSITGSCSGGSATCGVDCGSYPIWLNECEYDPTYSVCEGTTYICGGGNFTCSVNANGECPGPVSTVYESAYNTTQITPGSTPYEPVPADYAGEVCCWCSSASELEATSAPVPNLSYCNKEYLLQQDYFTAPDAVCQVWSPFKFYTEGLDCGLPES